MIALFVVTMFIMENIHALDANSIAFFFSISEIWPEAAMLRKELQTRHSISEADVLHTEGLHFFFTANNGQGLHLLECRMYFTLSLDNLISQ